MLNAETPLAVLGPNIGGPTSIKQRLLMSSRQSVLLYGAEVSTDALGKEINRKHLAQVQRRGALRVASAYREPAVMMIAGAIPVAFLAKERQFIHKRKEEHPRDVVARKDR